MPTDPPAEPPPAKVVPERFQVARGTLRLDRFMTHAIQVGGVAIILAVFGIFAFIAAQILPLFRNAHVEFASATPRESAAPPAVLGIDEWAEIPFTYDGGATVSFTPLGGEREPFTLPVGLPDGTTVTATSYNPKTGFVAVGTGDGRVGGFTVAYQPEFEGDVRTIVPEVTAGEFHEVGPGRAPVVSVGYGDGATTKVFAAVVAAPGGNQLHAITFSEKKGLFGPPKLTKESDFDLTAKLTGTPSELLVPQDGKGLVVPHPDGSIDYLFSSGGSFELRQTFQPFSDLPDPSLSGLGFVFGDVTLVAAATTGELRLWRLFRPDGQKDRVWGETASLPALPGPMTFFAASTRNKSFVTGSGSYAMLAHATTTTVRWEDHLDSEPVATVIDGKSENIAFVGSSGDLRIYELDDPHPEAGARAFFGKVWYEGATGPEHRWLSTGGTDDFELKLSMVPLIFGTLKGTLYAMLFAVPIALLAAVYTSQFLHWKVKRVVKPTMEIMASLPSVVLGFLGALWLAPILETRVPSVLLVCLGVPTAAAVIGWAWNKLPVEHRTRLKPGYEFFAFMPVLVVLTWLFWMLGPAFERAFFTVTDPATGERIADFRLWWPQATGTPFEQRNSLVVGFMMGFAVIPIIFTIAEDSLSNVPPSLIAGSSALGASRWQVVRTVVIPIAAAGIFSAVMIGLGRAVGETMIMVMATGNTPIMEWNVFSGMRTLSANIAVELPEAPKHSTHYRALFLGALILFAFTFVLNTIAEVLRHRLREKFRLV